jgi:hypothetical protein
MVEVSANRLKAAADRRAIRLDMRNLPNAMAGDAPAVKGGGDAVCVTGSRVVVAPNYGRAWQAVSGKTSL